MKAHEFPNDPAKVVVFNQDPYFETFCRCGKRAKGASPAGVFQKELKHLEAVGVTEYPILKR